MNLNITLKGKITEQRATVKMYYKFSNNEYRPILMDFSGNVCVKTTASAGIFWNTLKNVLGNNTNILQACPYLPGVYFIKDFNFNASHLPSILPAGRYLIKIDVSTEFSNALHSESVYFYVANYGILDMDMG